MLLTVLVLLFGDPRAAFFSRVLSALTALCPGAPVEAAKAIAVVAYEASDTDRAAVLLLAAGAHETCFRTLYQVRGPAVSWWQLEVLERERAALVADPLAAARRALGIARKGWGAYACGDFRKCPEAAAELRQYEAAATWALR